MAFARMASSDWATSCRSGFTATGFSAHRTVAATASKSGSSTGDSHTIGPHLFEVDSIAAVKQEIFGPVLQVVRWSGDPAAVIRRSTHLGFGLTWVSRPASTAAPDALARQAHVGNVYINPATSSVRWLACSRSAAKALGTGPRQADPSICPAFLASRPSPSILSQPAATTLMTA